MMTKEKISAIDDFMEAVDDLNGCVHALAVENIKVEISTPRYESIDASTMGNEDRLLSLVDVKAVVLVSSD